MVQCKYCGSENVRIKDKTLNRWYCENPDCSHKTFTLNGKPVQVAQSVGMSITEFTHKYDKEYILTTTLKKVMSGLKRDTIYERTDIIKLTGLGNSFPGMSAALEAYSDYYGKTNSKVFFSHPDTIDELKHTAKLS